MKVAGIQFKPKFKEVEENTAKMLDYVNRVVADVIIFPELATTGYFFQNYDEILNFSEEFPNDLSLKLQKIATENNKIIIYGFAERAGDSIYNSAASIFPDEIYNYVYRKTHLFYKEKFVFKPGNTGYKVINYPKFDLNLGMMICYDWRFPEAARTLALKGADLIVCPSNLVTHIWGKVITARAIENKVYLAVINRIGREKNGDEELFFNGESVILSYNGDRLAKADVESEEVIIADIDPVLTRNKSFNEFNDIFKDRRPEIYEL